MNNNNLATVQIILKVERYLLLLITFKRQNLFNLFYIHVAEVNQYTLVHVYIYYTSSIQNFSKIH